MEGKKHDTGKARPSLIPGEVYLALIPFTNQTDLAILARAMLTQNWAAALEAAQDLLCPSPHRDARLHGLDQILQVLEFGAVKYGQDNWQGVERQRYIEAAWRHLLAYSNGELLDKESGLPHMAHLGCCLVFLVYFNA